MQTCYLGCYSKNWPNSTCQHCVQSACQHSGKVVFSFHIKYWKIKIYFIGQQYFNSVQCSNLEMFQIFLKIKPSLLHFDHTKSPSITNILKTTPRFLRSRSNFVDNQYQKMIECPVVHHDQNKLSFSVKFNFFFKKGYHKQKLTGNTKMRNVSVQRFVVDGKMFLSLMIRKPQRKVLSFAIREGQKGWNNKPI